MNKQSGISTAGIALVIVVLAAGGGGFFGWQQYQELARTRVDLASARSALDKAGADARAAKTDAAAARKEVEDQKAALQQARSDAESAKSFLEMEKAHAARLQSELALAKEQMAYMRSRGSAPGRYSEPTVIPRTVILQPSRIEAIQVQRPQAVGVSPQQGAAQPAQGYVRPGQ